MNQVLLEDRKAFLKSGGLWVRDTAQRALDEILRADNPKQYTIGIDGTAGDSGNVRRGFRPGPISSAQYSVRVEFIGAALADVANGLLPILSGVIAETFPGSKTKQLQSGWSWWVQKDRYAGGGPNTPSVRLGRSVPDTVTIYDVLWLAPDFGPGRYAWFANHNAIKSSGHSYNLFKKKSTGELKLRKRLRGYLAEATRRMRGRKVPGITIQGWFVKAALSGPVSHSRFGAPVIRVAFKSGLSGPFNP